MQRRKPTFFRRARLLGTLVALVLLLSSCLRYEGTITIEDDGSGSIDLLTAIDPSAFALFGAGEDTAALCEEFETDMTSDFPADATFEPYNEDGLCGSRVRYALEPTLDHSAALEQVLDESTRLYKEGENWFFESNFDVDEVTGEASEFGGDEIVNDLFGDASFVITVDLPGRAVAGENNATNVGNDGRFTWDIDLLNPPARLFAQTEPGSGGGTGGDGGGISPILIGVIVLALLAAIGAFLYLRNRNSDSDTGAPGGPAPQPLGDPMAQPMPAPGATPPMPVGDGPAIDAMPPPSAPVRPADPGDIKETVVMNTSAMSDAAADSSIPTPEYDEALGAWVVNDPARGRLRHDPDTDSWIPI